MKRALLLAPFALLLPFAAAADESWHFTMPLAAAELPDGVLTVKVVGNSMEDRKVGQQVTLARTSGARTESQTAQTGSDGRARFDKLEPGASYRVRVEWMGQNIESQTITGPSRGGLRLLLTLGESVAPGGSPSASSPGSSLPPGHPPTSRPVLPEAHSGNAQPLATTSGAAIITPAPDLRRGQLRVRVVKGMPPRPLPDAMVLLPGDGGKLPTTGHRRTDSLGQLLLTVPESQLKNAVSGLVVVYGDMSYRSEPLNMPKQGGLEVSFTVYDRTRDLRGVSFAPGSFLVLQVAEDALVVFETLRLRNDNLALVDAEAAGLRLTLPQGARRAEVPAELKDMLAVDTERNQARFLYPLPPGETTVQLIFELPYQRSDVDFSQRLPLAAPELVATLQGRGTLFGPSVKSRDREAKDRFVLSAVPAGGQLEFSVGGLPRRSRLTAFLTLGLAGMLLIWALSAAWAGPRHAKLLEQRREALLEQLLKLQRGNRRGDTKDERRQELLEELSSLWEER